MKNKFKVGDKVRRIAAKFCGMRTGDFATVIEARNGDRDGVRLDKYRLEHDDRPGHGYHDVNNLELVGADVPDSILHKVMEEEIKKLKR